MITAIVLAAGEGRRLGGPKALAAVGGTTFVERAVRTCASSFVDEIVVVTGAGHAQVAAQVSGLEDLPDGAPVRVVENPAWAEGRTGSLQAGVRASAAGSHLLVLPVDHPCVRVVTLDALLGVFGYAASLPAVVVPVTSDGRGGRRRGHPVLLSATLREAVLALGPDQPLHDVVRAHEALEVPVDDPGVLLDVDEPADLERAERLLAG